jgi:hypothetical protein
MPKFKCDKGHVFVYPITITEHTAKEVNVRANPNDVLENYAVVDWFEKTTHRCPFCESLDISEFAEPQPDVSNVFVYNIDVNGEQTALNKLLAEGYKIVARYAKQYFLEKSAEAKEAKP